MVPCTYADARWLRLSFPAALRSSGTGPDGLLAGLATPKCPTAFTTTRLLKPFLYGTSRPGFESLPRLYPSHLSFSLFLLFKLNYPLKLTNLIYLYRTIHFLLLYTKLFLIAYLQEKDTFVSFNDIVQKRSFYNSFIAHRHAANSSLYLTQNPHPNLSLHTNLSNQI
jgi:hypothetical protein